MQESTLELQGRGIDRILGIPDVQYIESAMAHHSAAISRDRSGTWDRNDNMLDEYGRLKEEAPFYTGIKDDIKSDDPETRKTAISQLGEVRTPRATRALIYVADGNPRNYRGRVWSLGIPVANEVYDPNDRLAAIEALGKMGNDQADDYLLKACECPQGTSGSIEHLQVVVEAYARAKERRTERQRIEKEFQGRLTDLGVSCNTGVNADILKLIKAARGDYVIEVSDTPGFAYFEVGKVENPEYTPEQEIIDSARNELEALNGSQVFSEPEIPPMVSVFATVTPKRIHTLCNADLSDKLNLRP